jgi:hypothetical protein
MFISNKKVAEIDGKIAKLNDHLFKDTLVGANPFNYWPRIENVDRIKKLEAEIDRLNNVISSMGYELQTTPESKSETKWVKKVKK